MATRNVLTGEERRRSIIDAARPLFAQKGFHGTSIRGIARAANVSEALIYKHFASKKALFEETLGYSKSVVVVTTNQIESMKPGTETLIIIIYLAFSLIALDVPGKESDQKAHEKLLFRSLIGDISFARNHFKLLETWYEFLMSNYKASLEAGDIRPVPESPVNRIWFVHHLAMAINLCHLSGEPAFDYEGSREDLIEQAVSFCLRGGGMTEEAIKKYYRPEKLRAFRKQLLAQVSGWDRKQAEVKGR